MKRLINSFNSGELSPYLYARSDFEKYGNGCLTMENFLPLPYGGAVRRPGVEYFSEAKSTAGGGVSDKIRLIPFTSSIANSYQLEFGDEYLRFWKDGARINETETDIVEAATYEWIASGSGTDEWYSRLIPASIRNSSHKWTASGSGTDEWYCRQAINIRDTAGVYEWILSPTDASAYYVRLVATGGDPGLSEPDDVSAGGTDLTAGTLGSLANGEWAWGENEDLGYSTIYVQLAAGDPDGQADDYVNALYGVSAVSIEENTTAMTEGSVGSLTVGQWVEDNNDSLGGDTIYVRLTATGDPDSQATDFVTRIASTFTEPDNVDENGTYLRAGTVGLLTAGDWDFGDNDSLGYSTIYVKMYATGDPSAQADGFLTAEYIYEVTTPYDEDALDDIRSTQSVDVMWFVDGTNPIYKLTRTSDTSWTMAEEAFNQPPLLEENESLISLTPDATTGAITVTASSPFFNEGHVGAYFVMRMARSQSASWWGFVSTGTPFSDEVDVSSNFWNASGTDADFGFGTPVCKLQTNVGGAGWVDVGGASGTNWTYASPTAAAATTLARIVYVSGPLTGSIGVIGVDSAASVTGTGISASHTSSTLDVSLSDWEITTGGTWTGRLILERKTGDEAWEEYVVVGETKAVTAENFTLSSNAKEGINTFIRLKLIYTSGADFAYNISSPTPYASGIFQVSAYTSSTLVSATVISDLPRISSTLSWSEGAFSDYRGHPGAIAIYENRLIYGGTTTNPDTLWMSQIDDYNNFGIGSLDTDALKLTMSSGQMDEIKWMVPQKQLVIGTAGAEWTLGPDTEAQPITPTSFNLKRKTTYGSGSLGGLLVNSAVIFPMRQGRKIREWRGEGAEGEFVAPDLSILAEHITTGGINQWAFQQQPDNILWIIRGDGTLIAFTYERDQNVVGWHRHTIKDSDGDIFGEFESVSVLPKADEEDEVWVTVKITISNVVKRYICRLNDREWDTGDGYTVDWRGSDLYKVYTDPDTATLTGLDHLEGLTLDVVVDGVIHDQETVVNGQITVDSADYQTVVVGYPMKSILAPVYIEANNQYGYTQGSKKNIHKAVIRFKDTFSAQVGRTDSELYDVKFDSDESALYNGDTEVTLSNSSDFLKTCYVVQSDPMPCEVLAMIPKVEV